VPVERRCYVASGRMRGRFNCWGTPDVEAKFVVTAVEVLHERMPCSYHPCHHGPHSARSPVVDNWASSPTGSAGRE
jgi:hypothetical protein